MKSAGKARNNGLYRHIRTSKEIIRNLLNDCYNKYDITKHPKYRQLSDYDKRNAFDIEKYRQHKLVVKPDDTFDLYDMGEVEAD